MEASVVDLRYHMKDILKALQRNESVTILYRGKEVGVLMPPGARNEAFGSVTDHPAFGMWKDHPDMQDVAAYVRAIRKGRVDAL